MTNKTNAIYLNNHSLLKNKEIGLDIYLADGGVHPNLKCYQMMATFALEVIKKTLED